MKRATVRVKKLKEAAVLPKYGSASAAGADLYACLDAPLLLEAGKSAPVPTGIAIELPPQTVGLIYARSGLACRKGVAPANKVGVIDSDYRGEIIVFLHNHSADSCVIEPGDRIAQLVVTPYVPALFKESEALSETDRGGRGLRLHRQKMKALFYDLDGTLLIDGRVSERTLCALRRVRAAGNFNVLNTGRAPGYLPPEVASLPVWDGMICGSAYVKWRGEILSNACVSGESLQRVVSFCAQRRIPVVFEGVTKSYSIFSREPDLREVLARGIVPQITKITFWCDPARIREEDFPGFHIVHLRNYAEGILAGFDKKTGMEMIMKREGLTRADLWAFGDSENDLDMLRYVGNAVCMASAPAYFDEFCIWRATEADGVPEALDRFFPA